MFKAIHKATHQEIIALAPDWDDPAQLDTLRSIDRADLLICQGCKQSVRIKAGKVRIRHFAHKSLGTCAYGKESLAVLMTRALLYQRLQNTFGGAVTVEKQFDDKRFPRPVDCWLEREGMEPVAYWIVDAQMRPSVRDEVRDALTALQARVHWIFTAAEMLRPVEGREDAILLTTTERDLAAKTAFDAEVADARIWRGESLHYLDSKTEALTTYRSLVCIHEPQVYQGRKLFHPFSEVLVAPKTGEFAHPGERERLAALEQERQRQEADRQRLDEERRQREEAEKAALLARLQATFNSHVASVQPRPFGDGPSPAALLRPVLSASTYHPLEDKEGICIHCGQRTRQWWSYQMGTCKCYACRDKGLY